jgi:gluconate 2-dehydrogenase subunit 3-like protein
MRRRSFFKWVFSAVTPLLIPPWARGRSRAIADDIPADEVAALHELAGVALPASLGRTGTDAAADQFAKWIRDYKPGADTDHGYGRTRIQGLPPSPSAHYAEQLRQLDAASAARGAPFAKLDPRAQREIVEAALREAKVDRIPPRPNGQHIASDLMSHFFHSSGGEDFLYAAAIQSDDCRGLPSSGARPAPLKG